MVVQVSCPYKLLLFEDTHPTKTAVFLMNWVELVDFWKFKKEFMIDYIFHTDLEKFYKIISPKKITENLWGFLVEEDIKIKQISNQSLFEATKDSLIFRSPSVSFLKENSKSVGYLELKKELERE